MNKKVIGIIVAIIVIAIVGVAIHMATKDTSAEPEKIEKAQEVYSLKIDDKEIKLGDTFSIEKCGKELEYSEIESCAFEGLDKTYTYDNYEITTGEADKITSIYFIDEGVSTTEGVKITDSYDKMIETYGNDYKNDGNKYTYAKGNTSIEFIVESDTITGIEYVYNN